MTAMLKVSHMQTASAILQKNETPAVRNAARSPLGARIERHATARGQAVDKRPFWQCGSCHEPDDWTIRPTCQASNMSHDANIWAGHNVRMAKENEETLFNRGFFDRVRWAREKKMGWTAEQMATALGIPAERYRKYEKRTPLPPYLIQKFALITNVSIDFLLTGKNLTMAANRRRNTADPRPMAAEK